MFIAPLNLKPTGIDIFACGSCLPKSENEAFKPFGNPLSPKGFGRETPIQNESEM